MPRLASSLHRLDNEVLRQLNLPNHSAWIPFFQLISDTTSALAYGIPVGLLVFGLLRRNRPFLIQAAWLLVTVMAADYAALAVKLWIKRERPYDVLDFVVAHGTGGNPSFPSGHTAQAFGMAVGLALLFPKKTVVWPVLIWAFLVGLSRICQGVHYPSDVIGGAVESTLVACLLILPFRRRWA